jgi:hypothetical protein
VSLVGGVSLLVPPEMAVEVEGFRLFGRVRIEPAGRTGPVRPRPSSRCGNTAWSVGCMSSGHAKKDK